MRVRGRERGWCGVLRVWLSVIEQSGARRQQFSVKRIETRERQMKRIRIVRSLRCIRMKDVREALMMGLRLIQQRASTKWSCVLR